MDVKTARPAALVLKTVRSCPERISPAICPSHHLADDRIVLELEVQERGDVALGTMRRAWGLGLMSLNARMRSSS
jgi:hypothetical protein